MPCSSFVVISALIFYFTKFLLTDKIFIVLPCQLSQLLITFFAWITTWFQPPVPFPPSPYLSRRFKRHFFPKKKRQGLGEMGRIPCCVNDDVKKGPWTPEEDILLVSYIQEHGPGNWRFVPANAGNFFFSFLSSCFLVPSFSIYLFYFWYCFWILYSVPSLFKSLYL